MSQKSKPPSEQPTSPLSTPWNPKNLKFLLNMLNMLMFSKKAKLNSCLHPNPTSIMKSLLSLMQNLFMGLSTTSLKLNSRLSRNTSTR